jgi:hypothetical protein
MAAAAGGMDAEIADAVLSDTFPVMFRLAEDEVTSTTEGTAEIAQPHPKVLHLSRQSYLPLEYDGLREHFGDSLPPHADQIWCSNEADGVPLKWHRPTGVLFDAHGDPSALPWEVVVHFTRFPRKELLHPQRSPREDVQWHFMNTLKEGIFLQCGSTQPLTSLSMEQQTELWDSISQAKDVRRFAAAAAPIAASLACDGAGAGAGGGTTIVKNVPLRVVIPGRAAVVQAPLTPLGEVSEPPATAGSARPPPPPALSPRS